MASMWKQIGRTLGALAVENGPALLRQLQSSTSQSSASKPGPSGRPIAARTSPTAHRARKVEYSPDLDGKADPGEIVWTWVAYEEDPTQGKDRPVLVVGRDGDTLLGLMLSSQSKRQGERDWLAIGSGPWDGEGRPSWVRLDRVLDVPESGIRREGAVMDHKKFDAVAAKLRADFSWS
ncbi:type II toxin-antitoxin system PemK/MazF family toxin [Rhodococcus qingshengii]|uniref:type II toxin-antitoxin system PemK/MazF family toxin n=1 Tax=Rhodococcus qingshengii TaxID=334542 RepID=UPI0010A63CC5|nr:type II toxin-antitoxin system PemK/MazF family toxin [Rhodococcus qingshengii]THJ71485.1 type II toxin-antitoxin system PemK/MazF family toxin [Rhodococcus qingshengii]